MNAVFRRNVQLIAGLHVECRVPGIQVPYLSVHALLSWWVWIVRHLPAYGFLARLSRPYLRTAKKEALVARGPVKNRGWGSTKRAMICVQREGHSSGVRQVLAQRQRTVDMDAGQWLERRVLFREAFSLHLELSRILCGPPIAQQARAVCLLP